MAGSEGHADAGKSTKEHAPEKDAAADQLADVPDPDEDDLDDLDEMLDEFSAVKIDPRVPQPSSGPGPSAAAATTIPAAQERDKVPDAEDLLSDDDFAKQLQAGMADLLGEIETSPEMQAQFESIFKEIGAAAAAEPDVHPTAAAEGTSTSDSAGAAGGNDATFQDTIRRTMERMQASGDQATAAAAAEGSDDFLAELLKQMEAGGMDGEGNEEEFSKMLLGMMEQLTNKEILYEPMKELNDKFPDWLDKNKGSVAEDDLKRYEEQQRLVKEMVTKFEEPTYADSRAEDRQYIVDRMQKMQAAGSPPADLVGDMPSAQDALNATDDSCNPQ